MAGEAQDKNWPLPKFYFRVDWDSATNIPFQEVSGLDIEAQPNTNLHDSSSVFSENNRPGCINNSIVTIKKAVIDKAFWDWYVKIKMNTMKPQNVVIKLLDESGNPIMTWTLTNAQPIKMSSTDLKSDGSEIAIERIDIAHEGLTIANA